MKKPAFIITIDTEGDNLWQNHRMIKRKTRYPARGFRRFVNASALSPSG